MAAVVVDVGVREDASAEEDEHVHAERERADQVLYSRAEAVQSRVGC